MSQPPTNDKATHERPLERREPDEIKQPLHDAPQNGITATTTGGPDMKLGGSNEVISTR